MSTSKIQYFLDELYFGVTRKDFFSLLKDLITTHFKVDAFYIFLLNYEKVDNSFSFQAGLDEINHQEIVNAFQNKLISLEQIQSIRTSNQYNLPLNKIHLNTSSSSMLFPISLTFSHFHNDQFLNIVLFRHQQKDTFQEGDINDLYESYTHLLKAFELHHQYFQISEQNNQIHQVLDILPMGIVFCDIKAKILYSNRVAEMIFNNNKAFFIKNEKIYFKHIKHQALFINKIQKSIQDLLKYQKTQVEIMSISLSSGKTIYIRIKAIAKNNNLFTQTNLIHPAVMISLTDSSINQDLSIDSIKNLFSLTHAEARLVVKLVQNCQLSQSANAIGITENTARSYLKKIFAKTKVSNQAELVKLVLTSPVWNKNHNSLIKEE